MEQFPKITIITPSLNQGEFLEETIQSVISQSYPNLEYIIIDGGSTDNTLSIIKKYDQHLKYWLSENDSGQSEAINKGLERATGEIISWLCSDDLYLENTLFRVAEIFNKNPDVSFIHGKAILFGDSKAPQIKGADNKNIELKYFATMSFPQPSSFFRKQIIDEQGLLDESLHYGMDFDLLVRTALNYNLLSCDEIFSKYRFHNKSKSINQFRYFLTDWQKSFSKFLRSIDNTEKHLTILKQLNMYHDGNDKYSTRRKFSSGELEKIVVYFLEAQAHMYYHILDRKGVKEIATAMKTISPDAFRLVSGINLRASLLPAGAIRILRKLTS